MVYMTQRIQTHCMSQNFLDIPIIISIRIEEKDHQHEVADPITKTAFHGMSQSRLNMFNIRYETPKPPTMLIAATGTAIVPRTIAGEPRCNDVI